MSDEEILAALEKKALGYDYEETKVVVSRDGRTQRIEKITRHMPPDARAALLYMRLKEKLGRK